MSHVDQMPSTLLPDGDGERLHNNIELPAGVGFEELVAEAGVEKYVEFCNDAE